MPQRLPKNDSFAAPDWGNSTVGAAQSACTPYHFFYNAWNPSDSLWAGASEYSDCPFRIGGPLECSPFCVLYTPNPGAIADAMPVHMTDIVLEAQDKRRGFVCREEDSFDHDGLSVEVLWGLASIGASTSGAENQGSGGTGSSRTAVRKFPTTDNSGSSALDNLGLGYNAEGNTDGFINIDPQRTPGPDGWAGCAVAFRVGGGRPSLRASDVVADFDSDWSFRRVDAYILAAYPQAGATGALVVDVWRFNCDASNQVSPTLLVRQVISNGLTNWKKLQPYYLRAEVENSGGDVDITAYIGSYTDGGSTGEKQLFRAGVFTSSTISVGPSGDGAVATGTGVVTDSGTAKITAYTDKTIGVVMSRDRVQELSGLIGGGTQTQPLIEGLYRITAKRTDTGAEVFNDLFERVPFADPQSTNIDETVNGLFSTGIRQMGMFLHDSNASNLGINSSYRDRQLLWTSSNTNTTAPNDYLQGEYSNNPPGSSTVAYLRRMFFHKRPTDYRYNHYRQVEFKGAEDLGPATGTFGNFQYFLFARGQATQFSHEGIGMVVACVTDGSNNQIQTNVQIGRMYGQYNTSLGVFAGTIATEIIQGSGDPVPSGWDIPGVWNEMALKVERYDEGSDPNAPAYITAYWNGSPITFSQLGNGVTQDGSGVITYPSVPANQSEGRTEGFGYYYIATVVWNGSVWYRSFPQFRNWVDLGATPDPGTPGPDQGATIPVLGEGSPTTYLKNVVDIDWQLEVEFLYPRYTASFESGHRYTSPQFGRKRRVIMARADNIDKTTYDALVAFYNARSGVQEPFYFNYPIPAAINTNALEEIVVCFTSTGLQAKRMAEDVYSVELEMVEVFA